MTAIACLCAAASVTLGALYMRAAGAPQRYLAVNLAALAVGVIAAALLRRVRVRVLAQPLADMLPLAVGLLLVATAWRGVRLEGASRWISIAGISLQPSLILLPPAIVQFARGRGWLAAFGLTIASIGLAMQPDRAMAGTLVAGLATTWLHRRPPPVTMAVAAAAAGFAWTMLSGDVVPSVPFVEEVVQSAFAFHALAGLAIVVALLALLVPAAAGLIARKGEREVFAVFGATWLAIIAFSLVGNYPTPLVGYGSSAILGYCLSAAALDSRPRADAVTGTTAMGAPDGGER